LGWGGSGMSRKSRAGLLTLERRSAGLVGPSLMAAAVVPLALLLLLLLLLEVSLLFLLLLSPFRGEWASNWAIAVVVRWWPMWGGQSG